MRVIIELVHDKLNPDIISILMEQAAKALKNYPSNPGGDLFIEGMKLGRWFIDEEWAEAEARLFEQALTTDERVAMETARPGLLKTLKRLIMRQPPEPAMPLCPICKGPCEPLNHDT